VLRWKPGEESGLPLSLALLCGAYAIILIYIHNYKIYLYYENLFIGTCNCGSICVCRFRFPILSLSRNA